MTRTFSEWMTDNKLTVRSLAAMLGVSHGWVIGLRAGQVPGYDLSKKIERITKGEFDIEYFKRARLAKGEKDLKAFELQQTDGQT